MAPDFRPILETLELPLDDEQVRLLHRHYDLLEKWNARINLTSIRRPEKILVRHFGESLFLAKTLPAGARWVVDVGSGAGFPGFPLAVARPEIQVTLVESVAKKAAFLKEAARGVPNVFVFPGRFEHLDLCFDWAVVRGVAFEPLAPILLSKVRGIALLASRTQGPPALPGVRWQPPVDLPWGRDAVLLLGRCSTWNIGR